MVSEKDKEPQGLTQAEIVEGLRKIGLKGGDVVLVHSAMRTLDHVQGGAETVINAFLEILGPTGTLVAPTFTSIHEVEEDPIIDPCRDACRGF